MTDAEQEGDLDWREHNAHGPLWSATVQFRINNGPPLINQYAITEHEVKP